MKYPAFYRITTALLLAAFSAAPVALAEGRSSASARGAATATVVAPCDIDQPPTDRCGSTTRTIEPRTATIQTEDPAPRQDSTTTYRTVLVHFE